MENIKSIEIIKKEVIEEKKTTKIKPHDLFIVKDITKYHNYISYGKKEAFFYYENHDDLFVNIAKNKECHYGFVEKKTKYYKFIVNLNMKPKEKKISQILNKQDVLDYVVNLYPKILNEIFKDVKTNYIYADNINNKYKGIHLYFPHIIVNNEISLFINEKCIERILQENKFNLTKEQLKRIIDVSISKQNGLRLPYCNKNKDDYYKVNILKSTYKFKNTRSILEQLKACKYGTTEKKCNYEMNIALEKNVIRKNKKQINKNKIDDKLVIDSKFIKLTRSIELIRELLNVLSIKRLTNKDTLIDVVCYCRNFNLRDEIINICKKVNKYDDEIINIIDEIFNKPIPEHYYSETKIFEWCEEDNMIELIKIMEKYNEKIIPETNIPLSKNTLYTKIKGIRYEMQVLQILKQKYPSAELYLWNDIPKKYLYELKFYVNFSNKIEREGGLNDDNIKNLPKIPDHGCDILMKNNDVFTFVQCKNFEKIKVCLKDILTFIALICPRKNVHALLISNTDISKKLKDFIQIKENFVHMKIPYEKYVGEYTNDKEHYKNKKKIMESKFMNEQKNIAIIENSMSDKLKFFGYDNEEDIKETKYYEIVYDNKKFNSYVKSLPLFRPKENIEKGELNYYFRELLETKIINNIEDKIKSLYWLEDLLNIKRFSIEDIKIDNFRCKNIEDFINNLKNNFDKITILLDYYASSKRIYILVNEKIESCKTEEGIKLMMTQIYNKFNDFINYDIEIKKEIVNGKRKQQTIYKNFRLNEQTFNLFINEK